MTIKHSYNTVAKGVRQIVLDTETTGLVDARMVSIALIELVDGKPTGKSLYKLVNPEKLMDDFVISIHHITNEMAQAQPTFGTMAQEIRDFIGDSQVVITCRTEPQGGQDVTLDISVLNEAFEREGLPEVPVDQWLNVRRWSEEMFGDKGARLDNVLDHYNVSRAQRDAEGHGALLDAKLLAMVYPLLLADYTKFKAAQGQHKNKPPTP